MRASRRSIWKSIVDDLIADGDDGSGSGSSPLGVSITVQPANWFNDMGEDAVFSVSALSGNASALSYQWQERIAGVWNNLTNTGRFSGVTTATMTLANTVVADTGRHFRVIVTNSVNSKYSTSPSVTVNDVITSNFSVLDGAGTPFSVTRAVLDALGASFSVSGTVLGADGTPYVVI